MIVCPKCKGNGQIKSDSCDKCGLITYERCPVCDGYGRVYSGVQVGFRQYIYF